MKIAVIAGLQGHALVAALRAMLPDAAVDHFPALLSGERVAGELAAYDHVVSTVPEGEGGKLSSAFLKPAVQHFVALPDLEFRGFHPDQMVLHSNGRMLDGVTGRYHSRLAVAGFLAGLSLHDVVALYGRAGFARLGYFDVYEQAFSRLAEVYAAQGDGGAALVAGLRNAGCFMQSMDRPKPEAVIYMARLVCGAIGAPPGDSTVDAIGDVWAGGASHPVFADIAGAIGISPEGEFRSGRRAGFAPETMSLAEFVRGSFHAYRGIDRAILRGGDGVAAALAALGLEERLFGGVAGTTTGAALMTWHGTLLRQGPASGLHLPLSVKPLEAPWLRTAWADDEEPEQALAAGGLRAMPAYRDGMVALADGPVFLSADGGSAQTYLLRDAAGDSETFLPVSDAQLDVLAQLLSGAWAREDAAAEAGELTGGPAVAFGAARIELTEAWPRVLPADEDGLPRMAVRLDGAPVVLRQIVRPETPPVPGPRRVQPGERIVLEGEDYFQPLPLTLSNADRRWLYESCGDADGLPWHAIRPRAAIARARDQRMVGPPPPAGEALIRDAVLEDPVVQLEAAGGGPGGWMAPLLRLAVMAPYLQSGMATLALDDAGDAAALAAVWAYAGLPAWPVVTPPAGIYTARDVTWIDPVAPWQWPAETLQAARMVFVRGAPPGQNGVFLRGKAAAAIENVVAVEGELAALGFAVLDMSAPADEQVRRLREVGVVVGVGGDLLAAAFCPDGAKLVELSSDVAFRPEAWMVGCRLRMSHAVLPCAAAGAGFAVDVVRLARMLRVLKYRD